MARIEILTIGDELIEGRLTDTNAGELSDKLIDLANTAAEDGGNYKEKLDNIRPTKMATRLMSCLDSCRPSTQATIRW